MQEPFIIDTEYSSYNIVRAMPNNSKDIRNIRNSLKIPFIEETIEDICIYNNLYSKNIRNYVYEIIKNKKIYLTDPMSGRKIPISTTYTFSDFQTIFFFKTERGPIGVVASDLAAGFPLSTIIIFEKKIIFHLTDSFWGFREHNLAALAERGDVAIDLDKPTSGICLIAGDPNFAHHAWNELSTLQEISEAGLDVGTSLAVIHEPLGPVNEILGSHFDVIAKLPKAKTPDVNKLGFLTFCASGTKIDRQLAQKILKFAGQNLSPLATDANNLVTSHPQRSIWVSVRTRNRTLASQIDILTKIIVDYLRGRPDRIAIIDGYSLPFDHDADPDYIRNANEEIVSHDIKVAESVASEVKLQIPNAKLIKFVGRPIHESIFIGKSIGLYFCHHGTVQHKIGWFSSRRGIVHCNREVLQLRPDGWVKQQSEVAALPTYVPIHLIDDISPDSIFDELQQHLMHTNYKITDTEELSNLIENLAKDVENS